MSFTTASMTSWAPEFLKRRSDVTKETVEKFVTKMFRTNADFVFTESRDFVRSCQTPVLIMPDDVPSHPLAVAMECAMLAPKAEMHVPVEGAQGTDPIGGAPSTFFPKGTSSCVGSGALPNLAWPLWRDARRHKTNKSSVVGKQEVECRRRPLPSTTS